MRDFIKKHNVSFILLSLAVMIVFQLFQYANRQQVVQKFMDVGGRFTLEDGISMCQRLARLEEDKYNATRGCKILIDRRGE